MRLDPQFKLPFIFYSYISGKSKTHSLHSALTDFMTSCPNKALITKTSKAANATAIYKEHLK